MNISSQLTACILSSDMIDGSNSFAANISLVESSLQECLSQAVCSDHNHHDDTCISVDRVGSTKSYLGATDNMRLLW